MHLTPDSLLPMAIRSARIKIFVLTIALCAVISTTTCAAVTVVPARVIQEITGNNLRYKEPRGISITPAGTLLVTDFRNYRIQEVSLSGQVLRESGQSGKEPGQFNDPTCAVMDAHGNLYVTDTWNQRIQQRTANGEWIGEWAQFSQFSAPRGIAVDSERNRVYVANTSAHNIVVFDMQGQHLMTWGAKGNGRDQFHDPIGMAVGLQGNLYIADTGNRRIKVVSPEGETLRIITVEEWSASAFQEAYLAIGPNETIYVTLPLSNAIQVYQLQDATILRLESDAQGQQLSNPTGIAVDATGHIFVSDTGRHRLVKYAPLQVPSSSQPTLPSSAPSPLSASPAVYKPNALFFRIIASLIALLIISAVVLSFYFWESRQMYHLRRRLRYLKEDFQAGLAWFRARRWFPIALYLLAVLLIFIALQQFQAHRPLPGSLCLLSAILLVILRQLFQIEAAGLFQPVPGRSDPYVWAKIIGLAGMAIFFRVYRLDTVPWGINNDAAWNGMFALRFLHGEPWTPFTPEAWGKETLFMYLLAASFKLFGVSKLTLYLPGILAGTLTTVVLYLLCRRLFNEPIALLSAGMYAAMAWGVTLARTGYRAILSPLCLVLTVWLYILAVDSEKARSKLIYFSACGFIIGIGLNTYFAFRGVPLLMILFGLYSWITTPRFLRNNWGGICLLLFCGAVAFAPLGLYALNHMRVFMGRSDFLFVGNKIAETGSLRPLWDNITINLLTLYDKAKVGNFFNNNLPILSQALGGVVALGTGYHLRYIGKRGSFFVVLAFGFGLLPAILSAPDATRSLMTTIPLAIVGATGIFSIARFFVSARFPKVRTFIMITLCGAIMAAEGYFYFEVQGNDAGAQFGYARKHTLIGYKGLELSRDHQMYISQGHFMDTPKFICYDVPGDVFGITRGEVLHYVSPEDLMQNLQRILQLPVPDGKGLAFVFENTPENAPLFEVVKQRYPTGVRTDYPDERYGNAVIFYTYVIAEDTIT